MCTLVMCDIVEADDGSSDLGVGDSSQKNKICLDFCPPRVHLVSKVNFRLDSRSEMSHSERGRNVNEELFTQNLGSNKKSCSSNDKYRQYEKSSSQRGFGNLSEMPHIIFRCYVATYSLL